MVNKSAAHSSYFKKWLRPTRKPRPTEKSSPRELCFKKSEVIGCTDKKLIYLIVFYLKQ